MRSSSRFRAVNSSRLRALRLQLGWSQTDLASEAGYSERAIRKAEKGGSLNLDTISDLAKTFSKHGLDITSEELMFDAVTAARSFIECYDSSGHSMLDCCKNLLSGDLEFNCPNMFHDSEGNENKLISRWVGLDGFLAFLDLFFRTYTRKPKSLTPIYLSNKDRVVVRYDETLYYRGHMLPMMWVNLHLFFQDSLIYRIDKEINHSEIAQEIERINRLS